MSHFFHIIVIGCFKLCSNHANSIFPESLAWFWIIFDFIHNKSLLLHSVAHFTIVQEAYLFLVIPSSFDFLLLLSADWILSHKNVGIASHCMLQVRGLVSSQFPSWSLVSTKVEVGTLKDEHRYPSDQEPAMTEHFFLSAWSMGWVSTNNIKINIKRK